MKNGIDFFPLDVHLDEKFELVEAEFGLTGFAVIVKLFQRIYGQQGYYCEWTNEVALLFSKNCCLGGNVVSEIVSASIKRGIFNQTLYDEYHILTSEGIQKRYFEIVSRRKNVEIKNEYLLVNAKIFSTNVNNLTENVNKNTKNVNISEQSKVKESKVKKSKEKHIEDGGQATSPPDKSQKHFYGEFKNVLLTDDEHDELLAREDGAEAIEYLSNHIKLKGYKAQSHYLAILKWVFKAIKEERIREAELAAREKRLKPQESEGTLSYMQRQYERYKAMEVNDAESGSN